MLRYKTRGTIVKEIEKEGKIMIGNTMTQIIKEYFEQLYLGSKDAWEMKNNIFDYRLNIKRGIQYWALKKSTGIDGIPGEFYKNAKWQYELLNRLQNHFTKYLHNNEIPYYFMKAKLILVSKEKTEYPKIENIRPISVLLTITKVFELSILHHLENAKQSIKFCKHREASRKGDQPWITFTTY